MHDTAFDNGKRFFTTYCEGNEQLTIVDIGSQNVNGSLKECSPAKATYIGVDFAKGKGVDVLLTDPYKLPFNDNSVDIVVSSSVFEHSEMFWVLFLEVLRVLKNDGIFYLNVPSNGDFHRYPVDCYRFYPDSGNALAKWANHNGLNTAVLESYICKQRADIWNDFVCVFIKDKIHAEKYPARILHSFRDFINGFVFPNNNTLLNVQVTTQDQSTLGWKISKRINRTINGPLGRNRPG
ncbi:MAG: methyltransferase domain-containing protein [Candidatus Accumulibacter sp.]|uniref:Methyltransferase domain-containing protein n=1 Tax=Candidatus Accumulibacter proximus TaxID=2954385 RepID=A0A935UG84_9PROT|nr:methyltransferase domain-containing protein [Candidatus Accumulibacter proximus]